MILRYITFQHHIGAVGIAEPGIALIVAERCVLMFEEIGIADGVAIGRVVTLLPQQMSSDSDEIVFSL